MVNIVVYLASALHPGGGFKHSSISEYSVYLELWFTQYSASQKNPPEIVWHFFPNGWEFLVQILHAYYTFLPTLDSKFLFNYLQLWQSYTILSATTIMCSKCPPSTETHGGWSHIMWHNFVKVGDNWINICILAYIWTLNKFPTVLEKLPQVLRWGIFLTHTVQSEQSAKRCVV